MPSGICALLHRCGLSGSVRQGQRHRPACPGANHDGITEHVGEAKQTGREWGDEFSTAMLGSLGGTWRREVRRIRIPVVWPSVSDLRAGRRGITSHNNVSKAFRKLVALGSGPGFPIQPTFVSSGGTRRGRRGGRRSAHKADPPDMGPATAAGESSESSAGSSSTVMTSARSTATSGPPPRRQYGSSRRTRISTSTASSER